MLIVMYLSDDNLCEYLLVRAHICVIMMKELQFDFEGWQSWMELVCASLISAAVEGFEILSEGCARKLIP